MATPIMLPEHYRIYPSLLDKFQDLCDYEEIAAQDWNRVSEASKERGEYPDREIGDYKLSPDEMYAKIEAELINQINRCPKTPNQAADKGTAFNEIVDCLVEHRKAGAAFKVERIYHEGEVCGLKVDYNGWQFDFDINVCRYAASTFKGAICQYYTESVLATSYGEVTIYGYIDEWKRADIADIKTTSRYEFGKYGKRWQRHAYPWSVVESGMADNIETFTYWVVEWAYQRQGDLITAKNIYPEVYSYNHEESTFELTAIAERFIEWLHFRRDYITDKRIFGGENPDGYVGDPISPEDLI